MLLRLASGVVLLVCAPCLVAAADYPLRPLRLVVPFPPGGGADFMGRLVAQGLAAKRGYAVVVDNRGGAGGAIGAGMVAKATPDGYTLVLANNTTHVMVTVFNNVPPYDPLRDFTPVALTGYAPQLLVCALSIVPRNVAELIAYAKAKPGAINYASSGAGSQTHLAMELFSLNAGIRTTHIPYKGTGPGFTALMSGEVQCMFVSMPAALPHIQNGRIRGLAVTGAKRAVLLPAMPTIAEAGVRGFEINPWFGVLGPPKMPAAIVARLNADLVAVFLEEETRQRLASQGAEATTGSAAEFAALIKQDLEQWRRTAGRLGLRGSLTIQ